MKVYIVASSNEIYSEFSSTAACIQGVFSTKEKAEAFQAHNDVDIYEFEIDNPPAIGTFL